MIINHPAGPTKTNPIFSFGVPRAVYCVKEFEKTKHVLSAVEWANFRAMPVNSKNCIDGNNNGEPVQVEKGIIISRTLLPRRNEINGKLLETPAK